MWFSGDWRCFHITAETQPEEKSFADFFNGDIAGVKAGSQFVETKARRRAEKLMLQWCGPTSLHFNGNDLWDTSEGTPTPSRSKLVTSRNGP